jgi:hypothetical protein
VKAARIKSRRAGGASPLFCGQQGAGAPRSPARKRNGAAAAEMALLLPFLAFLFCVTVDFCRSFQAAQILDSAARSAALYYSGAASTGGPPPGPITLNAVGVVALSPPTSGTYQGITIFQDRSVPTPMSLQGINLSIGGTVYAAAAPVTVSGISLTGLVAPAGAFVCWRLTFSGILNGLINLEGNWPRVPDVRLVD